MELIFYPKKNKEPLKDFKQEKDMVGFVFLKYHSGSWIERGRLGRRQWQTEEDQSRGCGTSVKGGGGPWRGWQQTEGKKWS